MSKPHMNGLEKSLSLARANLGKSVIRINRTALDESRGKADGAQPFGIKNTALPQNLVDKLRRHPDFLWLCVDKMADLGRSVDTDLVNPLTYRLMTGSSSGGCVNILKGITSMCLGTDGGGSVLAPALATSLYSFMGQGCGLTAVSGASTALSTDGLAFTPGLGVIAARFAVLRQACAVLLDAEPPDNGEEIRLLVPAAGCLPLPGGGDARQKLEPLLGTLPPRFQLREHAFSAPYDRSATVAELHSLFSEGGADLVLSYEGPVDVFGYDETIPRAFGGPAVSRMTGQHGKALVKAANIAGCSAFTVPGAELAAGCVIVCGPGRDKAFRGFALAEHLAAHMTRPEIFERYFVRLEKFVPESDYQ